MKVKQPKPKGSRNVSRHEHYKRLIDSLRMQSRYEHKHPRQKNANRAIIRYNKTHVFVVCPLGHILTSTKMGRSFAGSMMEADISFRHDGDRFDRMAEKCKGYGHRNGEDFEWDNSSGQASEMTPLLQGV